MSEQLRAVFSQNKILKHADKIDNWKKGKLETIVTTEIDLTNDCNSNCPRCAGGRNNKVYLKTNQVFSLIDQLAEIEVKGITLTGGGEPLLHRNLNKIIEYISQHEIDIGIMTNGLLFRNNAMETILDNCLWCRISLDAGTKEMYQQTHGTAGNSFKKVVNNVRKLTELKKERNSDCTIGVGYLTGEQTIDEIEKFVSLSKSLEVDYCQLRPFHYDNSIPIKEHLKKIENLKDDKFNILTSEHKYERIGEEKRPYDKCYGCNFVAVVTADYNVTFCCHSRGNSKYTLGNLSKNTFREIWASEKRKEVMDSIDVHKCIPFCREDTINKILWDIKQENPHSNFL